MRKLSGKVGVDSLYYKCLRALALNPRLINGPRISDQVLDDLTASIKDPLYLKNIERVKVRLVYKTVELEAMIAKKYRGLHVSSRVCDVPERVNARPVIPGVKIDTREYIFIVDGDKPIGVDVKLTHDDLHKHVLYAPKHVLMHCLNMNTEPDSGFKWSESIYTRVYTADYWKVCDVDMVEAQQLKIVSDWINIPKCKLYTNSIGHFH